jgi:hypothetical protein
MITFNTSLPWPFKINLGSQIDLRSCNPSINRKIQRIIPNHLNRIISNLSLPLPTPNLDLIWKEKEPYTQNPLTQPNLLQIPNERLTTKRCYSYSNTPTARLFQYTCFNSPKPTGRTSTLQTPSPTLTYLRISASQLTNNLSEVMWNWATDDPDSCHSTDSFCTFANSSPIPRQILVNLLFLRPEHKGPEIHPQNLGPR